METLNLQKPVEIKRAVNCLWASLAIGLVRPLIDWQHLQQISAQTSATFTLFVSLTVVAVVGWLIYKISKRKNWARITYLVPTLLGSVPYIPMLVGEFERSPFIGSLSVVQLVLQIFALWLLFTKPGSAWFKPVNEQPNPSFKQDP
ncbi:MAG TPA: hypothetical protein VK954_06690 [Methyloradius sp.]|nr:hypothetical protein [Methyloradius sp.]